MNVDPMMALRGDLSRKNDDARRWGVKGLSDLDCSSHSALCRSQRSYVDDETIFHVIL
jgi:hypothetical protein